MYFTSESLLVLVSQCELEFHRKNDILIAQQEKPECCYVILTGRVSMYEAKGKNILRNLVRATNFSKNRRAISIRENEVDVHEDRKPVEAEVADVRREVSAGSRRRSDAGDRDRRPSVRSADRRKSSVAELEQVEADIVDKRMSIAHRISLRFSANLDDKEVRSKYGTYLVSVGFGALVGEVSLLNGLPRVASVIADTDDLVVMRIDKELFDQVLRKAIDAEYLRKRRFVDEFVFFR